MRDNTDISIVDVILNLPSFQGITRDQLRQFVEKYPFQFSKYADGETVVSDGQACDAARFLISGTARVTARHNSLDIDLAYSLNAPDVLFDNHIFGLVTTYPATITGHGECGIMTIAKHDYLNMMQTNRILLLNALNRLSRLSQTIGDSARALRHGGIIQRLALFLLPGLPAQAFDITMQFAWQDLCSLLGTTKSKLNVAINATAEDNDLRLIAPATLHIANKNTLRRLV